ncbi:uncharacterized protein A1O9_11238 [Exophiala aquamarina CBS 119918]|uniref:Transcription factor domain-containing protein n=1 Tax=Exophiala aquamarina CBS 119918 TaxID=1182545 RepID=A0A072NZ26_9EURO|nr:uncharacterized protein A1O9_11238 [Exophiala aquamarina CBS 119918]KEF52821.1 hypothetical protein A1O9_11238 [Exophiala aquamarina CBS 119918]
MTVDFRDWQATPLPYARNGVVVSTPANLEKPGTSQARDEGLHKDVNYDPFSFFKQPSNSPNSGSVSESCYTNNAPLEPETFDLSAEHNAPFHPPYDLPPDLQLSLDGDWAADSHWDVVADHLPWDAYLTIDNDIWRDLERFFDRAYIIFPVISYHDLTARLLLEPDWRDDPPLKTLLLSIRLINMAGDYRMTSSDRAQLLQLVSQVETSRLSHDFADPATLDAVVASLFLFTAYNVLEKYTRSMLYLDEAFSLLDAADVGSNEVRREQQLRMVLFNTEVATLRIYTHRKKIRWSHRASIVENLENDCCLSVETIVQPEPVAMHLLRRLTQVNLAQSAEALEQLNVESENDMATLFGTVFQQHRISRVQAADVAITRQWNLSSMLVSGARTAPAALEAFGVSAEQMGTTALSWICLLGEGELRIVGLGKVAALARKLRFLAGPSRCNTVLGGLLGAIIREDHEKTYAPQLADVVMPMASSLPYTITPRHLDSSLAMLRCSKHAPTHRDGTVFEDES